MVYREVPSLFQKFPGLKGKVPWMELGQFPTPVRKLEILGKELGHDNLFLKEDNLSGEKYGGNKVRKLEFALADAIEKGRNPVITIGAVGSNHVLATTIYSKIAGLKTVGVFVPQPVQENLRSNILCNCMEGCEIEYVQNQTYMPFKTIQLYFKNWIKNRQRPYLLFIGGSSTTGVLGYVDAVFEMESQIKEGDFPEPDYIITPAGSGGTLAGLVLGLKLSDLKSKAIGVRVVEENFCNEKAISFMAKRTLKYLRKRDRSISDIDIKPQEVEMLHDYFGTSYATYTNKGVKAIKKLKDLENLKLEGTYSGKAMAGFMDFMADPSRKNKSALFISTYNSKPLDDILCECAGPEILPDELNRYFTEDIAKVVD